MHMQYAFFLFFKVNNHELIPNLQKDKQPPPISPKMTKDSLDSKKA